MGSLREFILAEPQQTAGSADLDWIDHAGLPGINPGLTVSHKDTKSIHMATLAAVMRSSTSNEPVIRELSKFRLLRDRLLAEIPDLDTETLADTLEGITDLREMLAEVIRSALEDEALAAGLSTRLSDMKARLERLETRAKRKRELALQAMSEAEIAKLVEADFTASLRQGAPALEVVAEDKIPAAYWKPQPPKLDRQGLLAALKAGTAIEGAALAPPHLQLSVRTK